MLFSDVPLGPSDPMYDLKKASDADHSSFKIDVGIGVYRSESGGYHEFDAIHKVYSYSDFQENCMANSSKAKQILESQNLGHDYNPTTGIQTFIEGATKLLFGRHSSLIQEGRIASVQTVAGTGANRIGAAFLNRNFPCHSTGIRSPNKTNVYIGIPTWGNYHALFKHAGFSTQTYLHYDRETCQKDFSAALEAVENAPRRSVFVFQACCHNPTGQDYDQQQWRQLANAIQRRQHFVFFDIAYQGFASDMDNDGWCVRHFAQQGIDLLACQSFSKHMGLYSERVGVLHVVCQSLHIASHVGDQLWSLIRWEVSSTPAYGARLADIILHDDNLYAQWVGEVKTASARLTKTRSTLYNLLTSRFNTPGSWEHIVEEKGLFSLLAISQDQIRDLRVEHHIYLPDNGRINIAGLSESNIERFAAAVDAVLRRVKTATVARESRI